MATKFEGTRLSRKKNDLVGWKQHRLSIRQRREEKMEKERGPRPKEVAEGLCTSESVSKGKPELVKRG